MIWPSASSLLLPSPRSRPDTAGSAHHLARRCFRQGAEPRAEIKGAGTEGETAKVRISITLNHLVHLTSEMLLGLLLLVGAATVAAERLVILKHLLPYLLG